MAGHTHAHKARINFVVFPDRSPHAEEFRFVVLGEFRRREIGNDFLQLFFPINCARVRGQQAARFPPAAFLFRLEPLEELRRRVRVVAGANQVLSRQAVGPLLCERLERARATVAAQPLPAAMAIPAGPPKTTAGTRQINSKRLPFRGAVRQSQEFSWAISWDKTEASSASLSARLIAPELITMYPPGNACALTCGL